MSENEMARVKSYLLGLSGPSTPLDEVRHKLLAALPVRERRVQCAGIPTAVLEGGEGASVILLHGPFGNATHWLRVISPLTRRHHVVVPDLPGHGSSDMPALPLHADHILSWLGELIERCASSPPLLVGQTLGGAIAARFASKHSDRIRGLVLVDTLGLSAFAPQADFAHALEVFVANPTLRTHRSLWLQCAFDLRTLRHRMGPQWNAFESYSLRLARTPAVPVTVAALMQSFATAIPKAQLDNIAVPTALIWGRHDRATSLRVAQLASERHAWPLTIIEGAADDPAIEQPEAFLDALRTMLGERD